MAKTIHRPEYEVLLRRLRELRVGAGVTQDDLSERLGRSQSFVSDVERGIRRLDALELRDFCQQLGSDLMTFVSGLEAELAPSRTQAAKAGPKREGKRIKH